MISVIIPLMPIEPYVSQIDKCIQDIKAQTADTEILVVEQKVSRFINKNRLLNKGLATSRGDYIWHCDADFRLLDVTLLERMQQKIECDDIDVVYPKFYSSNFETLKIADGGPFMKRSILSLFALDETLLGISFVTFPLLEYCLTRKFHCSDEFVIDIDPRQRHRKRKIDRATLRRTRLIKKRVVPKLKRINAWPN
jgi:glycosyltransferase involved in cell wall biosynthesis